VIATSRTAVVTSRRAGAVIGSQSCRAAASAGCVADSVTSIDPSAFVAWFEVSVKA
jgi:hypothetical protein